jgi:taurine dioxygenase
MLRRERRPFQTIGVRPLSPMIGAEVEGLDLRFGLSAEEAGELRRAYLEHHVLVFRDQQFTEADHLRVASLFGLETCPERRQVTAPASGDDFTDEPVMLAESWRADETYLKAPPAGGALHINRLPKLGAGGDMLFANMHLAYDMLADPLQAILAGLTAVHVPDPRAVRTDANSTAEHLVVMRHPVTGRPAIFVNRRHTSHIVQLDPPQSDATLDMLYRHVESNPVLTCRIRWTPNALVVWDNFSAQHLTLQDFRPSCVSGHFVAFAGDPLAG